MVVQLISVAFKNGSLSKFTLRKPHSDQYYVGILWRNGLHWVMKCQKILFSIHWDIPNIILLFVITKQYHYIYIYIQFSLYFCFLPNEIIIVTWTHLMNIHISVIKIIILRSLIFNWIILNSRSKDYYTMIFF